MGRSPQQGGIPHSYDRSGQQGWNTPEAIFLERIIDALEEQINSKGYAIPYEADHRKVVKVGINFDSTTRTIGDWKIETD